MNTCTNSFSSQSLVWEHAQATGWATVGLTKPTLVDKKISGSEQVADEQVVTVADGDMVLSAQPEKEMTAAMLLKSSGHAGVSLGNNSAEVDFSIKALKHINVDKLKVIPKANSSFSLNQCRHG